MSMQLETFSWSPTHFQKYLKEKGRKKNVGDFSVGQTVEIYSFHTVWTPKDSRAYGKGPQLPKDRPLSSPLGETGLRFLLAEGFLYSLLILPNDSFHWLLFIVNAYDTCFRHIFSMFPSSSLLFP